MSTILSEQHIAEQLLSVSPNGSSSDGYAEIPLEPDTHLKCAAVLLPLVLINGNWNLVYTRRTEIVESHKGQVSFPGGACDPGEEIPEQTALREANEEIGVLPQDVHVLGRLPQMITITRFRITPVVGVIPWPYTFRVSTIEVGRVFTMPLEWLADPGNRWEFPLPDRKFSVIFYHPFDGELLWGATARMTVDFLKLLGY
jgi:8-oxo-dGTP pyrophosphatase MutT (NUDIX family)